MRSCFIEFPTMRAACNGIVALDEMPEVIDFGVHSLTRFNGDEIVEYDRHDANITAVSVYFVLEDDRLSNDGERLQAEASFISAASTFGGTYTGS